MKHSKRPTVFLNERATRSISAERESQSPHVTCCKCGEHIFGTAYMFGGWSLACEQCVREHYRADYREVGAVPGAEQDSWIAEELRIREKQALPILRDIERKQRRKESRGDSRW